MGAGGATDAVAASGWDYLGSFSVPALIVLLLVSLFVVLAIQGTKQTNLEKRGTPGHARVLTLKNIASSKDGYKNKWEVGLRVEIPGGRPYDVVHREWLVQPVIGRLQPGSVVAVRVSPKRPDKVFLDLKQPSPQTADMTVVAPEGISGLGEQIKAALQSDGVRPATAAPVDPLDQLAKLAELRRRGVLTDAEFEVQKRKLLGEFD